MISQTTNHSAKMTPRGRGGDLSVGNSADGVRLDGSVDRRTAWPMEFWLRCQADLLRTVEPVTLSLLQRQREAADAGLQAIARLAVCGDVREAATIQHEWFAGAVRRFGADVQALAEQAAVLSQEAATVIQQAALATTDSVATPSQKGPQIDRAA